LPFTAEEVKVKRVVVERESLARIEDLAEDADRLLAQQELILVGNILVRVPGGDHQTLYPKVDEGGEQVVQVIDVRTVKQRRIGADTVAASDRSADRRDGGLVCSWAFCDLIVNILGPVEVDDERQSNGRVELVELLLQQEAVGAEVDEPSVGDDGPYDVVDLSVQEGLASRNRHNRRVGRAHRCETLVDAQAPINDVAILAHAATAGAGEIAGLERLEHRHQRKAAATLGKMPYQVTSDGQVELERAAHDSLLARNPIRSVMSDVASAANGSLASRADASSRWVCTISSHVPRTSVALS